MIDGDEEPNTIGAAGVRTFSQCDERRTPRLRPLVTAITATLVVVPWRQRTDPSTTTYFDVHRRTDLRRSPCRDLRKIGKVGSSGRVGVSWGGVFAGRAQLVPVYRFVMEPVGTWRDRLRSNIRIGYPGWADGQGSWGG